jgi:hypothetical protein
MYTSVSFVKSITLDMYRAQVIFLIGAEKHNGYAIFSPLFQGILPLFARLLARLASGE